MTQRTVLGGRYQIHPDRPLPRLDSPTAPAVEAGDLRATGRNMFALVCRQDLLPRIDIIPPLSRFTRMPMMTPVDAGVVPWPQSGGRRFVIVFEHAVGDRVLASADATITPLREDELIRLVVKPLVPLLKEMSGRLICHRAIRADNLFYADSTRQSVILGECVSAPPGLSQPIIYETIEGAMARPSGRGAGLPAEDLYAFGVALVVLLRGGNPAADMSDEELTHSKICNGSYTTLLGRSRVSLNMMEPLRGLLCDDPGERWTANDLDLWVGGRQLSPKQPMLPAKAMRAISFAGREYWSKPALVSAMARHWTEARQIILNGELEGWIRRSFSDEDLADAIHMAAGAGGAPQDRASSGEDRLISRVLMLLDPTMPIRYRSFAARAEGLTRAFAMDYHDPELRELFVKVMDAKLPQAWLQLQSATRPVHGLMMKTFDMVKYFMDRPHLGGGLERALYESNPSWPCLSPLVEQECVCEIEDLLPALERRAKQGIPEQELVDAHVVAFCASRSKPFPDRILQELNDRNHLATRRLGMLHLLAEAQRSTKHEKFPALTEYVAGLLGPVVESYHNRAYRARLAKEIRRAAGKGDLRELLFLADSLEARVQDTKGFDLARAKYRNHARGITWLEKGGLTDRAHVLGKSRQAATVISAILSGLTIVFLAVIYVM
ncbi:MAG: hypothetical protein ACE5KF_02260 [Kiloniellaceae bacterium]